MASKWNGQPCDLCGEGTLHDGIKTMTQEYKGKTFSSETRGAFCDHCADGFVEFDEAEEASWLVFRDQVDAAQAAELTRIRKKLRLTQIQAAHIAGVAHRSRGGAGELISYDLRVYTNVTRWLGTMKALPSWGKVNEAFNGFVGAMKGKAFEVV